MELIRVLDAMGRAIWMERKQAKPEPLADPQAVIASEMELYGEVLR